MALYKKINGTRTSFVSVTDIEDVSVTVLTLADTIGQLESKIEDEKSQIDQLEAQLEGKDIMCQQYEEQVWDGMGLGTFVSDVDFWVVCGLVPFFLFLDWVIAF